jgi:hypothetical protein
MASGDALLRLASAAPRDLVRTGPSGRRLLHDILLDCRAAELTTAPASDNDVALLHALFDVALRNGLGSLVYDYVVEVCSDKYCTSRQVPSEPLHVMPVVLHLHHLSAITDVILQYTMLWGNSDALEAYLMDGDCVKTWCSAVLEREQHHILQCLSRGLASLGAAGDLHRHVGCLAALVTVLEALAQPGAEAPAAAADSAPPLLVARQLHQCAQVHLPLLVLLSALPCALIIAA